MNLKRRISKLASHAGLDLRKIRRLKNLPRFLRDKRKFEKLGGPIHKVFPILGDFTDLAGNAKGHYYHQDLLVARYVFENEAIRHIDVGSRIDGFVAHVASFRKIDVIDIRPLEKSPHKNINFLQFDMMEPAKTSNIRADSVSCLHALEHFGLGRYGDRIDPDGHLIGFQNLVGLLEEGGRLYISVPIGSADAVHFNAHRIFHPSAIMKWAGDCLSLEHFDYVDDRGDLHCDISDPSSISNISYGCGIYTLQKVREL